MRKIEIEDSQIISLGFQIVEEVEAEDGEEVDVVVDMDEEEEVVVIVVVVVEVEEDGEVDSSSVRIIPSKLKENQDLGHN